MRDDHKHPLEMLKSNYCNPHDYFNWWLKNNNLCLLIRILIIYSEASLNQTLRKPATPEYRPIFFSPCLTILCKRSLTNAATPLNRPICLVPVLASLEKFHCIAKMSVHHIFCFGFHVLSSAELFYAKHHQKVPRYLFTL
jgi:hypothetical protein